MLSKWWSPLLPLGQSEIPIPQRETNAHTRPTSVRAEYIRGPQAWTSLAFLFAKIFGIENNIYMQTGVIMLIGLLAKTAILLTEYASQNRDKKMSITDAALDASRVRLRPILMTSLTMIFGLLPMVFASGAGANGNMSLGVGTVGGMLIGTVSLLFIVPVLFTICQKIQEKLPKRQIEDI